MAPVLSHRKENDQFHDFFVESTANERDSINSPRGTDTMASDIQRGERNEYASNGEEEGKRMENESIIKQEKSREREEHDASTRRHTSRVFWPSTNIYMCFPRSGSQHRTTVSHFNSVHRAKT